jgi:hypothetical protein
LLTLSAARGVRALFPIRKKDPERVLFVDDADLRETFARLLAQDYDVGIASPSSRSTDA